MQPPNIPIESREPVNDVSGLGSRKTQSAVPNLIIIRFRNFEIVEEAEKDEPPKIHTQFTALKEDLKNVSWDEWDNLPEPHKIDETNRTQVHLHVGGSATGATLVEPKGYLTPLSHTQASINTEIGDIRKAQMLLESVTLTNPSHAPGWIARARILEASGKLAQAQKIIAEGCTHCPHSDDVWLEAVRLNSADPAAAKALLALAVSHVPESVPVWMAAAKLETDIKDKRHVYRKAIERIPTSPVLWRAAVELEQPDDARIMLMRAVECVPHDTELWIALAKRETYENAKKVLNKARESIPKDKTIWIAAAQLEEANGNTSVVNLIIQRAVKSLADNGAKIDHNEWLSAAQQSEKEGYPMTCQSIVTETIGMSFEEQERKKKDDDNREKQADGEGGLVEMTAEGMNSLCAKLGLPPLK